MILREWNTMPEQLLVNKNWQDSKISYSKYFDTTHNSDGRLAPRAKIQGINAYEFLKDIIHNRYIDTKKDFLTDGTDNFRCKLCGFKHGNGEIMAVTRFKRKYEVGSYDEIDGNIIHLPEYIDMGSTCMIDHKTIMIRHNEFIKQRNRHINQIEWFKYAWKSYNYCYINSNYREGNRVFMNNLIKNMKNGGIIYSDLNFLLSKAFYNCLPNNMPIRLYKGIGADKSLSHLHNIYEFLNGYTRSKFHSSIIHTKDYIEIPSTFLYNILKKR